MKWLDYYLQKLRCDQARRYIKNQAVVLDVGCADGFLLKSIEPIIARGVGIDGEPDVECLTSDKLRVFKGFFPDNVPAEKFTVITMLAVAEHFPEELIRKLPECCGRLLEANGTVIMTMPSPLVDKILAVLHFLKLIDGMDMDAHDGRHPSDVVTAFENAGWIVCVNKKFQFGLNNLFIFQKPHGNQA